MPISANIFTQKTVDCCFLNEISDKDTMTGLRMQLSGVDGCGMS